MIPVTSLSSLLDTSSCTALPVSKRAKDQPAKCVERYGEEGIMQERVGKKNIVQNAIIVPTDTVA